jgi:hypothetical protein
MSHLLVFIVLFLLSGHAYSLGNVRFLGGFVSAAEQDDDFFSGVLVKTSVFRISGKASFSCMIQM